MRARLRKVWLVPAAATMAILLSSCFTLQAFSLLVGAVPQGGKTTARFTLRPLSTNDDRFHQFVIVGVPSSGGVSAGKATWGTNGTFGGPERMPVSADLPGVLATDGGCSQNGVAFEDITNVTWKGYLTDGRVRTRGLVDQKSTTDVVVRAASDASTDTNYAVWGVTGVWDDDGDGIVETQDDFLCTGLATVSLYVEA